MSRRFIALVIGGIVAMASCAPPPAPGPRWVTTRLARTADATATVSRLGAWTDDEWFATVEVTSTVSPGSTVARPVFYPRTGPNGSVLGAPQVLPPIVDSGGWIQGEHLVILGGLTQHFYRESAGVWAEVGTFDVPLGYQPMAMTDEWLALRRVPGNPENTGDGEVQIYAIDAAGPTVTATLATTLGPDPSWPDGLREGFGRDVALDGDVAVVSATDVTGPNPGAARAFRVVSGTWTPVATLGGAIDDSPGFGTALAVDDGPSVDRIVLTTYQPTSLVRIYADSGSGFGLEQDLLPDPPEPSAPVPDLFGAAIAIDGSRLAVVGRATTVASAEPGHDPVRVGHVLMYRRGATWTREAAVRTFPTPFDPDVTSAYPYRLKAAGDHVAVSQLMSLDPPVGCPFPCFAIGMEAWSLDRR